MKGKEKQTSRCAALAAVCVLLALGLLSAACGGSAEEAAAPAAPSPTPSPTVIPAIEPVSQLDGPGTATTAQALAVGKQHAAWMMAETLSKAHSRYAADATWDYWESDIHLQDAKDILDTINGAAGDFDWARIHVLAAPGLEVSEGVMRDTAGGTQTVYGQLDAVDGNRIVHEEVFGDNPGGLSKRSVVYESTSPGAKDTPTAAARAARRMGEALAAGDRDAAGWIAARDILFYDTELLHGVQGTAAFLAWVDGLPDVRFAFQEPMAGRGWAAQRWTAYMVPTGGLEVAMPGVTVYEVRDGKVARMTLYYDNKPMALQE